MKLRPVRRQRDAKLCTICRKPECTRARPLCRRKDNPRNLQCSCSNYPFPHRIGSGRCQENAKGHERMWAEVDRPIRKVG